MDDDPFYTKKMAPKRHRVHIDTKLSGHGIQRDCTIHDISCIGSNTQTDINESDLRGARIDILLGGRWREAKIIWSNTHYMGVQFIHFFRQHDISHFREKSKK